MPVGTKRKRHVPSGLHAGERLKRDQLAGADIFTQWGWIPKISDPSQIIPEHRLAACGFHDKIGKPICKNKYSMLDEPEHKKRKTDVAPKTTLKLPEGEDAGDIIVVSSDDEEPEYCTKKRCKENPQCVNYVGQIKLENGVLFSSLLSSETLPLKWENEALRAFSEVAHLGPSPLHQSREPDLPIGLKVMFWS